MTAPIHHEQKPAQQSARSPPANFLTLPAELRQAILLLETPFPSQTSHERLGVLMHFGILQRAEATQRRIRTLMKVHPEMIGDVSYATKNDIEALDRECQETHGESMERLRLRLSSYNLNAFYYSPLCWNRRQAIREQAKCWRSFWPRLRKEIDYLEEKWIFELMQRHSYQVDSETYLEDELQQKDQQMRSALDSYSESSGIGERGEKTKRLLFGILNQLASTAWDPRGNKWKTFLVQLLSLFLFYFAGWLLARTALAFGFWPGLASELIWITVVIGLGLVSTYLETGSFIPRFL